ncbi:sterol desaturase family protein [Dongia mobilis]|uniref:sterol desaturase family protein n=1 Tax=Dongia sp. TaxID=1977262 RepID=UPI0026EC176C
MTETLLAYEPQIRAGIFAGMLLVMMLWEVLAPRRPQVIPRRRRWPANLGIVILNAILLRLIFPIAAMGMAVAAEVHGWGLLNQFGTGPSIAIPLSVLLLDLAIYLQHRLFHAVPLLWRLHRMHHADLELDVTTGARFHPVEILLSMLIKIALVAALGAPAVAVLLFEILLNATAMFNHSNVAMPTLLDRLLRRVLVTPDMHRVHHSVVPAETDSNFGFNLSLWDRLLGTYRAEPAAGQLGMTIVLELFRDPQELRLDRMLLQPLRDDGAPARKD